LSTNTDVKIHRFFQNYVQSKEGKITQTNEVFTVAYPNEANTQEYTYQPAVAREKKISLISTGSPALQQMLKESLQNGVLCQVILSPKNTFEEFIKETFKDSPYTCQGCYKTRKNNPPISLCIKPQPCFHQINNAKIVSIDILKKEPLKYYLFYFSTTFQNKLRPKNEEILTILFDEKGTIIPPEEYDDNFLKTPFLTIQDCKSKIKQSTFEAIKTAADKKLAALLTEKLVLFDLPLNAEKKAKLANFEKRLKRERREQLISKKHDFDFSRWQTNYEALLLREEDSLVTHAAVKFLNLLIINTVKVKFQVNVSNKSTISNSMVLGLTKDCEINCPICKESFTEGYATTDNLYVCKNCIHQSIDNGKIYSTKTPMPIDDTLKEFIEQGSGFICSVCGKRHSRLLEYRCSHDNSSVCIHHYGLCDVCGNIFSKNNLSYTQEFKRKLCPNHIIKCERCQLLIGLDEAKRSSKTGMLLCSNCILKEP
jgi:hypothetical protein